MKKLIEYKLWAGQIPYFVDAPLGGVFSGEGNGKCYGVSKDTCCCYLPDTVKVITAEELAEVVQASNLMKASETNPMEIVPMTSADKADYLAAWLTEHGVA